MSFSYDRVWADVVAMVRANFGVLLAITGVFLFLPSFAMWMFAPLPQPDGNSSDAVKLLTDYYAANWLSFLVLTVVSAFGQATILVLLLDRTRPTVGEALSTAARVIALFVLMEMLVNLALAFGFLAFIVPGIYLMGRLIIVPATMIAEATNNPIEAIQRGFAYTAGLGWRIAGLVLLIAVVGWIALAAASSVIGVIGGLLLPDSLKPIAAAFGDALGGAGLGVLLSLLGAAIYRQLRGGPEPLQEIFR